MMTTASELIKRGEGFPALSGNIVEDTETIIGELAVGTFVVERGMARLYLVWLSKAFLGIAQDQYTCLSCGLSDPDSGDQCLRCGAQVVEDSIPLYPTLELYLAYVSEMTGKSRQTLFSRLRVYRVLCEERGANPESVFNLNLLSSGAASKLASADEGDNHIVLENDSWQETVERALGMDSKSGALEYIKYDVLLETRITSTFREKDNSVRVYREYHAQEDQYVLEEYRLTLDGEWPGQVRDWLVKRLGAKVE